MFSQSTTGLLLVANKGDNSVGIIDPVAGKQNCRSRRRWASPGTNWWHLPMANFFMCRSTETPGLACPEPMAPIWWWVDIAARKIVGNVDFGKGVRPHLPMFGPRNGLLYVSTELNKEIAIIDPATLKNYGAFDRSGTISHVRDYARRTPCLHGKTWARERSLFSISTRRRSSLSSQFPGKCSVSRFLLTTSWLFTSDVTKPQLAVIDTATNKIKTWIPMPGLGYGSAPYS